MNSPLDKVLTEAELAIAAASTTANPFDFEKSRAGPIRKSAPKEMPFVIDRLIPVDVGVLNATGGTGKSTLIQWMVTHIALGRDLFGYKNSLPPDRRGVVILSIEDSGDRWGSRLNEVYDGMRLTEAQKELADSNLYFIDRSSALTRFVDQSTHDGNLVTTAIPGQLIETYKDKGIALVIVDPLAGASPGERFVNDGYHALVVAARQIVYELHAGVLFIHHVNKEMAQNNTISQHSGRGGTALGDGCRLEMQLAAHTTRSDKMPLSIGEEMLGENGTAYALYIHKLTDAKRPADPIWIYRQGFSYSHHAAMSLERSNEVRAQADLDRHTAIARCVQSLVYSNPNRVFTKTQMRDACSAELTMIMGGGKKVSNVEAKSATEYAMTQGWVWEEELPEERKTRGVTKHLVAAKPEAEPPKQSSKL